MSKEELVDFLKEQIKTENEIVDSLSKALVDIQNPAVKATLKGISLDSVKHAEMYNAAAELLTSVLQALTQEQLDKQRELIEKHIDMEIKLIKRISEVMPSVKDEKVKLILNAISTDEKRHHALLKEVLNILVRGETITEKDWFEVIWRNVPFHGSPGG